MIFGQSKPAVEKDPLTTIREAEADRLFYLRENLNREMMRLSQNERRRRWTEYLVRLDVLMKTSPS